MSIVLVMPSRHLILCLPLLLPPSIFPILKVFSNEPALHIRWPKYWSFSFSISPSNKYSGLISFRTDWFDLPAIQGTHKNLEPQFESINSFMLSLLMVQLSHPYVITGKNIAFVNKVMSLLFNMLSRFFIVFLPRSKQVLISWLQSPSAVILQPKKIKSATLSISSPFICHKMTGPDAMILFF